MGQTTSYGYDTQTGILNWTQAPGETTATRTNYSHDSRYRTTGVSKGSSSVGYTYNSDLLAAISSASDTNYSFTYGVFDLISSVKVGSRALISHTYSNDANRWLTRSDYGNGDYITYAYDCFGRTTGIGYEDKTNAIGCTYDNNGNLGILTDNIAGRKTKYSYDFQDRLMRYEETASGHRNTVQWEYDDKNNLASQTQILNGTTYTTSYSYDNDNRLKQATSDGESANYTYDAYSRMTGITAKSGTKSVVATNITYKDPSTTSTSTQVYKWTVGGTTYTYTYDARGNITAIADGSTTTTYVYDSLDQLTRENNQAAGKTWVYTYDNGGNILTKKEYDYTTGTLGTELNTISYGYDDSSWKDLLTSYGWKDLTSDAIGNLINDGDWTYTWQHGRQLEQMLLPRTIDRNREEMVSFSYDAQGKRIGKHYESSLLIVRTDGDYIVTTTRDYSYHYLNDTLTQMKISALGENKTLHFTYDAIGPMSVNYDGTEYYYLRNAQGDVTGLVDADGTQVVTYTYDAWGNPLSVTGSKSHTIGEDNPFRYRGYFYDTETGLYYVSSRYYDPEVGRWISPEPNIDYGEFDEGSEIFGYNMYAYCFNNPVNNFDPDGEAVANIVGGVIGGVAGAALGYLLADALGLKGWKKWALISAATVGGAVLGAFLGPYVAKLGSSVAAKLGIKSIPKLGSQIGRLGKLVKNTRPAIKGLTRHGLQRMTQRGVSQSMAQNIVRSGHAIAQSGGKTLFFTKAGVVVLNKAGEVVTAYSSKYFDAAMKEIIRQFYG